MTRNVINPVTAATMVCAPLMLVAAEVISPVDTSGDSIEERVNTILDHAGRYSVAVLCLVGGLLLLVPAVQALRRLVDSRGQRLAAAGAAIACAGFMLFAVASGALGVGPTAWADLPDEPARDAAAVQFFESMDDGNGAMPVPITGPMLPVPGLVVLAVALWRSGYPRWAAAALPLGWTLFLAGPGHAGRAAGALILLAGLLPGAIRAASWDREHANADPA